jgi:hypothetical protein
MHRTVMSVIDVEEEDVTFGYPDEDSGLRFVLSLNKWTDLGNPTTITISVEAGDLLNVG